LPKQTNGVLNAVMEDIQDNLAILNNLQVKKEKKIMREKVRKLINEKDDFVKKYILGFQIHIFLIASSN